MQGEHFHNTNLRVRSSQWRVYKSQFVNHIGLFQVYSRRFQRTWKWRHIPPSPIPWSQNHVTCAKLTKKSLQFTVSKSLWTVRSRVKTPPTQRVCSWCSIFAKVHERTMKTSVSTPFFPIRDSFPIASSQVRPRILWRHQKVPSEWKLPLFTARKVPSEWKLPLATA